MVATSMLAMAIITVVMITITMVMVSTTMVMVMSVYSTIVIKELPGSYHGPTMVPQGPTMVQLVQPGSLNGPTGSNNGPAMVPQLGSYHGHKGTTRVLTWSQQGHSGSHHGPSGTTRVPQWSNHSPTIVLPVQPWSFRYNQGPSMVQP